jgi:hypothetical protein
LTGRTEIADDVHKLNIAAAVNSRGVVTVPEAHKADSDAQTCGIISINGTAVVVI